ncbi:hypothetical protein BDV95DRAFT_630525 [Massariosphaeria phaeospora]|uniref:RRM domain-containing protein n=1 Tax=Massariosphaeria phaeospora TaxID=100035 RepID=A0A7C8I956_9PLEO|nr:hypothetical protein BDV95DRAFT_630525 [Massariosphaeria phaeospora]
MSGPGARHWEQNKEATIYVGNLHESTTQQLLHQLAAHHGRVQKVHIPIDRVNGKHQGFGFVEYNTEADATYAANILNNVALFGQPLRVNKASADKQKNVEIGAELFVGNLDAMVDEKTLYDVFSRFGSLTSAPKIARDQVNMSKGYGFISYADFEASDAAIEHMDSQYIMNKAITVQYAFKKDGKGERHGDDAERMLAKQAKAHGVAPAVQPLPAHLFQGATPNGPQAMLGDGRGPHGPSGYGAPRPGPAQASLPPPPSGLPARPPTGAPANFFPPPNSFGPPPFANGSAPPGFGPPGYR